ncbi:hypothetical protein [Falsirhodobacter sp. 1013]
MTEHDPRDPLCPTPLWRSALQRGAFILVGSGLLFAYGAFAH